jgi:hypothetical protein
VARKRLIALVVAGVIVFLLVTTVLARVLSGDPAEQSAVTALIQDEARGSASAMLGAMDGCSSDAACRARVMADAVNLKRPGSVSILQYQQSTGFSLTTTNGIGRVAWEVIDHTKPIVQCVQVRRAGNVISGIHVELRDITTIKSGANCPKTF